MLCLGGLAVPLLGNNSAISAEEAGASSIVCAEREVLLMVLVEAHGASPNAASDKLAAEGVVLTQARTACANGHASDATVLYDRLIAELATSLAQGIE
jgi:hypothetical protein